MAAKNQAGFTLLEVLVALAILATALYATSGTIRSAARQQSHLQDTVLAHWAASDLAVELSLVDPNKQPPPLQRQTTVYGRAFVQKIKPTRSEDDKIVAVTIDVALESAPQDIVQTFTLSFPTSLSAKGTP